MEKQQLDEAVLDVSKPLTNWENEPKVTDLKEDYTSARTSHTSQTSKMDTWVDNLHIRNSAKRKKVEGRSNIQPKLIRKQAEWRYPALSEPFLSTPDIFNIDPVTFEDKQAAIQNALILNNQFNTKIDKVKFIDDYVRAGVDTGTVIVRVGWEYEEEDVVKTEPVYEYAPTIDVQAANQIQQAILLQQSNPVAFLTQTPPQVQEAVRLSLANGQIYVPIVVGEDQYDDIKIIKNNPTVEVCDYNNVVIDPSCGGDYTKAKFVIYSFETCKADLEKSGLYENLDNINFETASILSEPDHSSPDNTSFNFKDESRKKIVAYEYWGYWDINGDGELVPIVATYVGNTIIRMEESPFPDGKIPFIFVPYLPETNSVYGIPDGDLLKENQDVVGAVTRGMIDIMGRSANGQTGYAKDALDVTNRRRYKKGQDYEFNPGVIPERAFHMHKYPEIPQSAQFMINLQNAEAESMSGVKAFAQGISGSALGDNVGGIRSAMDAASKRELAILRRLAAGIIEIGRRIIAMNAEFLSEEEVVRVTNDNFVQIRKDDLAGDFDLRLSISTAEADNEKAQELAFMLQTMGNNMNDEMSRMILADIARLRKMPDLAKKIEEFQPQADPIEQEKLQLENNKLKAEIQKLISEAQENGTDAALNAAKAQTEQAKAKNLGSDTDLKNLDFIEKESGVTQERDLQKIERQAESQAIASNLKSANNDGSGTPTVSNGVDAQ